MYSGIMDLTQEPICVAAGVSTSLEVDADQPMSIMITHEQNKILRVPNRDMSLRQQQSLHTMLTGIALDPDSFARQQRLYVCPYSLKYFKKRAVYARHLDGVELRSKCFSQLVK